MTDFTRVTVVGSQRRAVVVVPNDETISTLVPQLMELLGEPAARIARPLTLVRLTGEQLDADRSPAELAVADGELLRLIRLDEAPPPPEVSDVTDAVSEELAGRAGRWNAAVRLAAGTVAVGLLAGAAGLEALLAPTPLPALPAALQVVAAVAAAALGLARLRRAQAFALAVAVGLVPAAALTAAAAVPLVPDAAIRAAVLVALGAALLFATLLLGWGVGGLRRAAALGSLIGVAGPALLLGLLAAHLPLTRAGAITAVVAVVVIGLLPAYAMGASGLTAIDDRVIAGRLTARAEVLATLGEAYRTLTWATVAIATVLGGALVAAAMSRDPWVLGSAGAVALVALLRTRAFPLRVQVLALWTAVGAGALAAALTLLPPATAAGAGAIAAVAVAVLAVVAPAPHRRARLRRLGTLVEAVAVVALVPLLLGAFGVYPALLGAFGSTS